jgi:DNA mismatch repair protein MutS
MRQHARFKSEHPDCVLFFRMGDFYEMFDADAELVHRVLGLTLTQRTTGIPMAGVPYHALDGYLQKMLEQGYRVAVCDQIQDPRDAKGVVDRAVTRVLTPGTLVDEALLEESVPNQVAALHLPPPSDGDAPAVIAAAEISTGRFTVLAHPVARLADELVRLRPTELLYAETDTGAAPAVVEQLRAEIGCAPTARPAWTFRPKDARDLLCEHYRVTTLAGFGLADDDPALGPAGALLRYLQETQAPDGADGARRLAHLQPPRRDDRGDAVVIDAASLRSLEIERTMRTGQTQGSLLSILQHARTPMGKRLLRQWLCFPLRDRAAIEARLDAVATLRADADLADDLVTRIAGVQDVARIAGRVSMGRASPRDVVALGRSLAQAPGLVTRLEEAPAFRAARATLVALLDALEPLARTILEQCVDAPPAHLREGGLFADGVDAELDEARGLERDADAWLAAYQKRLVDETGIPSLKVGYNRVFGYYIEVTHVHAEKVPDAFSRKQTLKNAERYVTPELKTFEERVTTARSRANERERQLFEHLSAEVAVHAPKLAEYAGVVAELDVLASFADVAARYGYVRPTVVPEPVLDIRQGRHPVLDRRLGDRFVPNDCAMGRPDGDDGATLALITGPNMAGKSTFIRQVAIIALLAHTGCFVPAESAVIGLTDRIFTRIGAADELHEGQSTFMVEMTETANILHHATDRSLVILDEIGRGTSTLDGLALAWAIAESIAATRCRALFATHYHELTDLADRLATVTNLHVSVREWGDEIIFLYRILPGRTDRSYGIHQLGLFGS